MTEQKELDELLRSSSSENELGQDDYSGDFEPEQSASGGINRTAKKSDRKPPKTNQDESMEDFELIDEDERVMKKQPTSVKALNKVADIQKPKSSSKGSKSGESEEKKPSKLHPDFSKNKNKTDSVPVAPTPKINQVLTLDQFEQSELEVSPTKSVKIRLDPSERIGDSVPESRLTEQSVGEQVDEDIGVQEAVTQNLEESLAKSEDRAESSEQVVSMVVESRDITQSSRQRPAQSPPRVNKPQQRKAPVDTKPISNIPQVISLVEIKENANKQVPKPAIPAKKPIQRPITGKTDPQPLQKKADRLNEKRPSTAKLQPKEQQKDTATNNENKQQREKSLRNPPTIRGTLKIPLVPPPKQPQKEVKKKAPEPPNFGPKGQSTTGLSPQQYEQAVERWKIKQEEERQAKRRQEDLMRRRSKERFNEHGVSMSNMPQGYLQKRIIEKKQRDKQENEKAAQEEEQMKKARREGRAHVSPNRFGPEGVSTTGLTEEELKLRLELKNEKILAESMKKKQEEQAQVLARKQGKTRPSPPKFDKFGVSATGLTEQQLKEKIEKDKQKEELKKKYLEMVKEEQQKKDQRKQQKLDKLARKKKKEDGEKKENEDDNDFKVDVDDGDEAQPPQMPGNSTDQPPKAVSKKVLSHTAKSVSETSSVKALEAQQRLKRDKQKKQELEVVIQNELKKKINVLNKEPEPPKPEKVKQLRKLLKEDELKNIKKAQASEKKDSNSTEIMHLKDRIKQLRLEQRRLKERIVEQQELTNRFTDKIRLQEKQDNVLIVDKNRKEYTSYGLVGDLKKVAKTLKAEEVSTKNITGSEESPVEKFVAYFQSQSYELAQIFTCLDVNGDGILTTKQMKDICSRLNIRNLSTHEMDQIITLLDYNSDGSISKDEFDFIIGSQLDKKMEMNKILGSIRVDNPIEIEERILDMKARIKYMNGVIDSQGNSGHTGIDPKHERLMNKLKALQDKVERRRLAALNNKNKALPAKDQIQRLSEELRITKIQAENNERLFETIKNQIDSNIKEKTECLKARVEEHLHCRELLYQLENELHEKQLRFLTYKKIYEGKMRHMEQAKDSQRDRQQHMKETMQYRAGILNQKTRTQLNSKLQQMTLLSAVLMIQRNYRRRKAMRDFAQARKKVVPS